MARSVGMIVDDETQPFIRRGPDREAEARSWHVRLHSGDATDAERRSFAQWRAEPENDSVYAEVEALWNSLGAVLGADGNVVPLRRSASLLQRQILTGIAASILAMLACGYQYAHVWQYDYVTQGTTRQSAVLSDGTRITLNTGTAIDVDYANGVRHVTLARGEAYFDVHHDPLHPFIVRAADSEIRVLGTAFSVVRNGTSGRVVVRRGKVRVQSGADIVDITPNQSVVFGGSRNGTVRTVDATADLAWSGGRLFMKDKPLREVIATIERYYPGVIVLANKSAGERRISATIKLDNIDEWFAALGRSQHIVVSKLPGFVLLT